jgi:hypothetical protein
MTLAESPSSPRRSLNLKAVRRQRGGQSKCRGFFSPEEHPGLWGVPLREAVEVPSHSRLEHITLRAIEVRDSAHVREEAVAPPCAQEGDDDRLCEGRRLQVCSGRLRTQRSVHQKGPRVYVLTCLSIASISGVGPVTKPMRMPAEIILLKLSKRNTRPTLRSPVWASSAKYDGMRSRVPKYMK